MCDDANELAQLNLIKQKRRGWGHGIEGRGLVDRTGLSPPGSGDPSPQPWQGRPPSGPSCVGAKCRLLLGDAASRCESSALTVALRGLAQS